MPERADEHRPLRRLQRAFAAGDAIGLVRRRSSMAVDQGWVCARQATARALTRSPVHTSPGSERTRFAIVVVNFSTTRYLKLMLATLADQSDGDLIGRVIVVDNDSRDPDRGFLDRLAEVPIVDVVRRRWGLTHAQGLRAGVRALADVDPQPRARTNVLLFVDPDVIFRDRTTLRKLAECFERDGAALVGEFRGAQEQPDIQASFLAIRRDVYERATTFPPVHHGSPTQWLQRSVRSQGARVVDFPSNRGGYILHRGRAGVDAAGRFRSGHAYSTATTGRAHYMGVPDGAAVWRTIEARYAALVDAADDDALIARLRSRLGRESAREADPGPIHVAPPPRAELDESTSLRWHSRVLQRRLHDGIVVLGPVGEAQALSGSAAALWSLFEHPTSVGEAADAVHDEFALDAGTARQEIARLAEDLLAAGLLVESPGPPSPSAPSATT